MRVGWFRPVHCKSLSAQETRAVLAARRLIRDKLHDVELSLRGLLRNFGLKVGKTTPRTYEPRILQLVGGHPTLEAIAGAMLEVRQTLRRQFNQLDRRVRALARESQCARLLMTTHGVGPVVALDYASALDDPARFKSSRKVGCYFGLTQRRYQSGQTDIAGRISKIGDKHVRSSLYEAAHVILTRVTKPSGLKDWAQNLAKRAGMRKATVALARKLAVVMHRMLRDQTPFNPSIGLPARAAKAAR